MKKIAAFIFSLSLFLFFTPTALAYNGLFTVSSFSTIDGTPGEIQITYNSFSPLFTNCRTFQVYDSSTGDLEANINNVNNWPGIICNNSKFDTNEVNTGGGNWSAVTDPIYITVIDSFGNSWRSQSFNLVNGQYKSQIGSFKVTSFSSVDGNPGEMHISYNSFSPNFTSCNKLQIYNSNNIIEANFDPVTNYFGVICNSSIFDTNNINVGGMGWSTVTQPIRITLIDPSGNIWQSQVFSLTNGQYSAANQSTDLAVPLLKQTSTSWQSQEYDTAHLWNPTDPSINAWGCALTSAAMILQYYGIYTIPGTNFMPLNPGTLNDWLKSQPDGYVGTGWINWQAIARLSKLAADEHIIASFDALEYSRVSGADKTQLTNDINNNIPDILEEPGHFIVAKGINGNTFDINDPYFNLTSLDNTRYNNAFLSIGRFTPSMTDLSYVMLTTDPNTTITVKDQQGNIVGSSFVQSPIIDTADGVSTNSPIRIYYLPKPDAGTYMVTGTNTTGPFQVASYLYDKDGNPKMQTFYGIGNNSFIISFDKTNSGNSSTTKVITFESTLQDINYAQNLKLIDNGLGASLTEMLKNAQKKFSKQQDTAKILLNNGMKFLDSHQNQTHVISPETYVLLKNDFATLANSF